MPFRFPNPADVKIRHASTLTSWNDPQPLPSAEGFAELQVVRRWALRSKTAQTILAKIDGSKRRINVVLFRRCGETVFSSEDPTPDQGTIFWDVDARFGTKQVDGTVAPMHHYIAFLHECGHAVQWLENPAFFSGNMLHGPGGTRAIQDAAKSFWRKQAKQSQPGASFKEQNALAEKNMVTGNNRLTRPAWNVRIEMDNLMRHEWPICAEARYPRRLGYTDLAMGHQSFG